MVGELWIYLLMIMFAGILSLFLCFFSYFKLQNAPGSMQYMMATLLSSIFTISYVFELQSTSLKEMKFWLGIEYYVMPFIPAFLLWMCYQYVGVHLRKRFLYLLFAVPLVTVFTHHTNELHHLYYKSVTFRSDAPIPILDLEYGPFFYVHSFYLFVCLSMSIGILLLQLRNSLLRFRMQILTMVMGLFVPIVANYFYLNDLSPYGIDLGPVSMSISFIFHGLALFSFQMFNVLPIAREKVFESMLEGVIVLSDNGTILDYNEAIRPVMPMLGSSSIGKSIQKVLSGDTNLAEVIGRGEECDYEWVGGPKNEHYQIRFSPVLNKKGIQIGNIISFVNITERVELQEKLKQLASYDGLTQVYNRTYFMEESITLLQNLTKENQCASLLMFDLDHFKQINDTYGHETGDKVLTQVAHLVKENLRPQDLIGRYGGEEFIILLPEMEVEDAIIFANMVRARISESLISVGEQNIKVTSSFGVSNIRPNKEDFNESMKLAIRQADHALYMAKRNGRNNVQLYDLDKHAI